MAGLGPAIHALVGAQRRGCPRQARAWRCKKHPIPRHFHQRCVRSI